MSDYENNYNKNYYTAFDENKGYDSGKMEDFFKTVSINLPKIFDIKTHLDVGCAFGFLTKHFREAGIESYGVDSSEYAVSQARSEFVKVSSLPSLKLPKDFPKAYDLVTCIEVLEHIQKCHTEEAIKSLCSLSSRIVFSSTSEDTVEKTHINIRSQDEWVSLFKKNGFKLIKNVDLRFICPHAMFFRR